MSTVNPEAIHYFKACTENICLLLKDKYRDAPFLLSIHCFAQFNKIARHEVHLFLVAVIQISHTLNVLKRFSHQKSGLVQFLFEAVETNVAVGGIWPGSNNFNYG